MLKVVDNLTLEVGRYVLTLLNLLLRWQRTYVLFDERTDCFLIVVADDSELVSCCISSTLLSNLQNAVVVHVLKILYLQWSATRVATIKCCTQRVVEYVLWLQQTVLQTNLCGLHKVVV